MKVDPAITAGTRPFAGGWLIHGLLLVVMSAMLGAMAEMVSGEDWAMAMEEIGAGDMVITARAVITVALPLAPGCAVLGFICLAAGAWAWFRWSPAVRWTLQILAAIHLLLAPWLTWYTHGAVPGSGGLASEIIMLLLTEAGIIWVMVLTQRTARR
jgi:hypothetical protein